MELFEKFYDEQEKVQVRFVGFATNDARYDFGMIYTDMFFGKPLVVCMQTGRSTLLDSQDLEDIDHIQNIFHIESREQAEDLVEFFKEAIPSSPFQPQYD